MGIRVNLKPREYFACFYFVLDTNNLRAKGSQHELKFMKNSFSYMINDAQ